MSEKIVQLNEESIMGEIKELVRGSVEETLNKLLDARGGEAHTGYPVRAHRAAAGIPQRALQLQSHHHFWRCHPQGTQVQRDSL